MKRGRVVLNLPDNAFLIISHENAKHRWHEVSGSGISGEHISVFIRISGPEELKRGITIGNVSNYTTDNVVLLPHSAALLPY